MDEPSLVQKLTAEVIGTAVLVFIVVGVIHRKAVAGFAGPAIAATGVGASVPAPADAMS
jgi:glycerol uptake facilitator protein